MGGQRELEGEKKMLKSVTKLIQIRKIGLFLCQYAFPYVI